MSKGDVIKLSCSDDEMHYLYLGEPSDEVGAHFVYARKSNYSSLDVFLEKALALLDAEEADWVDDWDNYTKTYRGMEYTPASKQFNRLEIHRLKRKISDTPFAEFERNHVTVIIDNIISIMELGPQEWNETAKIIETETEYFFYHWYTNA